MSTESKGNRKERTFRYRWPAEVVELARSARGLGRKEQSAIVTQIIGLTGYPRRACRRLVKHVTRQSGKRCYVWPAEIESMVQGKRRLGGAERTALLKEIMVRTGYPRRLCLEFLRRRLGFAKPPIPRWPVEAREFVESRRAVGREEIWSVVGAVMKMTGRPRSSCWKFVHRILGWEKMVLRRWPAEVRALVRKDARTEGPEFEALVAQVKEHTGYEESECRLFILRAVKGKQYSHYQWPKEARELVRMSRGLGPAGYRALVEKLAAMTGNPKAACRRWLRGLGVKSGRRARPWTALDRRRLAKSLGDIPIGQIAQQLRRTQHAVRRMIAKSGLSVDLHRTWFTVTALAEALGVQVPQIRKWIELGVLRQTEIGTGEFRRLILTEDNVKRFCLEHGKGLLHGKVNSARLKFLQKTMFPSRSVPVREMKKRKPDEKQEKKRKEDGREKLDELDSKDDPDIAA